MKYIVLGLGNPGPEYAHTRHNIGFHVLDTLATTFEARFSPDRYGDRCEIRHKGRTFILIKPSTFMNLSGKAIRYWLQKEKIPVENSLTILDDLNLEFGKLRLRAKGSDGGHNGLKNIQELLGSDAYPRLRIGIGHPGHKDAVTGHVLGNFAKAELEPLTDILAAIANAAPRLASGEDARFLSDVALRILLAELERSLSTKLKHLPPTDRAALEAMVEAAANKLLHAPITHLKRAASEPAGEQAARVLHEVFELPDVSLVESAPSQRRKDSPG